MRRRRDHRPGNGGGRLHGYGRCARADPAGGGHRPTDAGDRRGGISDGRGLAAALVLGAQGANIGTRFLASVEASCGDAWKQAILASESEDAVKVDVWTDIFQSVPPGAYATSPRAMRTPFIDEWQRRREEAHREASRLQDEILGATRAGRLLEYVPFTGQTAGAIHDILPAAEIVRRLATEAEAALAQGAGVAV